MSEERLQMHKAMQAGVTPFAVTTFRNRERVFGIKIDDRRRHVYVIGKTGMGKTTLIENMVYSDIIAGHGVCYVDPHGDTAEKMLGWIPSNRINDVIYFNPSDINFPISFNVLEKVAPEYRHLISSGLIGVFKKQWADSWGPRLEYILRNAILALLEYPDSTLLGINRILVDKVYRKKVVDKVQDPVVRSFWLDEFTKWNDRVLQEVISPIQNKVGQFLSTALIRNIVGQVRSSIDLRKVMDEGKILILNLSKGRIGEDASALLGAMMVTKIQLSAMSRVDIQEDIRKDFYLYVDEFQNFATDSFANILSEARKYRLNLIIAHQYIEQLGEVVKPAVFGNVGTIICFRVGAEDAEFLENEFAPNILPEDLVNLPKYNFYTKLMIDGVTSEPFSAKGLPPVYGESLGNEEKAIRASRERYTKPRDVVEDKIMRWSSGNKAEAKLTDKDRESGVTVDVFAKRQEGRREERPIGKKNEEEMSKSSTGPKYQALCYNCGNEVEVPFKPDNVRPVYCKDCLKKARRGDIKMSSFAKASEDIKKVEKPPVSLVEIKKQTVDFGGKPIKEGQNGRKEQKGEEGQQKDEAWKKEIVKPWEIKANPTEKPDKPEIKKDEKKVEKPRVMAESKPVIKAEIKPMAKPKEIFKPEIKALKVQEVKAEPAKPILEKPEKAKIETPKIKVEIKPVEKPKEIKMPEIKNEAIKPSFASTSATSYASADAKAMADKKATEVRKAMVDKKAREDMEKKPTLENKVEKPKEPVKESEIKVVKPELTIDKSKEVKKEPEVKIVKKEELPKKEKMPSVDLLGDAKKVNEGETVEL
ncbi:MAG: CxxC-x17-CxxC domain-containing protein [Patescibacteria group bacterium]